MLHHGSIRKYTAALLDVFNGLEIQTKKSDGSIVSRNVPIRFSSKEKSHDFNKMETEQLLSGNYNILPRANLAISALTKSEERITNKYNRISSYKTEDSFEFMYNSVPYELMFELAVQCRGMNEATMIIEQVLPKFNPIVNLDIWEAENLDEPTRVPLKLLDVSFSSEEYEEFSSNIVTVEFGLAIKCNFYPPIKTTERIKDFKMYVNEQTDNFFDRKSILNWDVNEDGEPENGTKIVVDKNDTYPPEIISIVGLDIYIGENELEVIFKDNDNKFEELTFNWEIISGSGVVLGASNKATLTIEDEEPVEVQCTITDIFGNYNSLIKTFTV